MKTRQMTVRDPFGSSSSDEGKKDERMANYVQKNLLDVQIYTSSPGKRPTRLASKDGNSHDRGEYSDIIELTSPFRKIVDNKSSPKKCNEDEYGMDSGEESEAVRIKRRRTLSLYLKRDKSDERNDSHGEDDKVTNGNILDADESGYANRLRIRKEKPIYSYDDFTFESDEENLIFSRSQSKRNFSDTRLNKDREIDRNVIMKKQTSSPLYDIRKSDRLQKKPSSIERVREKRMLNRQRETKEAQEEEFKHHVDEKKIIDDNDREEHDKSDKQQMGDTVHRRNLRERKKTVRYSDFLPPMGENIDFKNYDLRTTRREVKRFDPSISTRNSYRRDRILTKRHNSSEYRRRSEISKESTLHLDDSSSSSDSDDNLNRIGVDKRDKKLEAKLRGQCMPINIKSSTVSGIDSLHKLKKPSADTDPLSVNSDINFNSVGGLDHHIKALKEMVALPLLYPEIFTHFNITPPRGVLFYGPPGTGKTLLARALANACSSENQKVAFFMRKGADCLSKWVGEAERQLRLLFDQAKAMQPSIIFFDEIDGLAPVRSSKQEQIHSSIVSTLLALMDGLDSRGQVIVIGATNRIDAIDPALQRPGRFDREFYFPLPDKVARRRIIDIHTSKWQPALHEFFKAELADLTSGYCGADIKALCTEVALNALYRRYPQIYDSEAKLLIDVKNVRILRKDFQKALKAITPASKRAAVVQANTLPEQILSLLEESYFNAIRTVAKMVETNDSQFLGLLFNKTDSHFTENELEFSEDDEYGDDIYEGITPQLHKNTKKFNVHGNLIIYRPRFLICGQYGMGQNYLGPAILNYFEKWHVQTMDLSTLFLDCSRTPEASCAQCFIEARRHKPSIIYIPCIDVWWTTVSESIKSVFLTLLEELPSSDPVLLLATSNEKASDLNGEIGDIFATCRNSIFELSAPDEKCRTRYFEKLFEVINRIPHGFRQDADGTLTKKQKKIVEILPLAPPPPPRQPTDAELEMAERQEERALRQLRINLRAITEELFKERRYKPFFKPVDPEEVQDYYEIIEIPMDLSTIMNKINNREYLSAVEYLNDIDQIVTNAIIYNSHGDPDKVIYRAKAFQDLAYSLIADIDQDILDECLKIAEERRKIEDKTSGLKRLHHSYLEIHERSTENKDRLIQSCGVSMGYHSDGAQNGATSVRTSRRLRGLAAPELIAINDINALFRRPTHSMEKATPVFQLTETNLKNEVALNFSIPTGQSENDNEKSRNLNQNDDSILKNLNLNLNLHEQTDEMAANSAINQGGSDNIVNVHGISNDNNNPHLENGNDGNGEVRTLAETEKLLIVNNERAKTFLFKLIQFTNGYSLEELERLNAYIYRIIGEHKMTLDKNILLNNLEECISIIK